MQISADQVAVVTGAASGIGLALVEAFVARGLSVAMLDLDPGLLESEAGRIGAMGGNVMAMPCDVRDLDSMLSVRDRVLSSFGRVDILCNNAGVVLPFGPIWATDPNDWRWIVDINLNGVFNGISAFVPLLVAQGSGYVLNTASMAGVSVIPTNGAYNATKHAVVSMTETLRADLELVESSVGATVICCGMVRTGIRNSIGRRPGSEAKDNDATEVEADYPSGTLDPSEVARQALEAIESDKLYLFTNPGSGDWVRTRVDRLLADV